MRPDSQKTVIQYALQKLSRRFYSRQAMRQMLSEEGYDGESVENTLAKLEEWGYLDDLKLARYQLRRYTSRQPKGRLWIERRLIHEGVEPGAVCQVLEEYAADQESALAAEAARRFVRSKARTPSDSEKIRGALARFLAARGFSSSLIREILHEFRFTGASDLDSDDNWH
jgi:regulatory protein